jgi:hypothetical protein
MFEKAPVHAVVPIWLLVFTVIAFFAPIWSQGSPPPGKQLYLDHCAACHGAGGKGNGPSAPALKTAPPDLTLLAKNNGGRFPSRYVLKILETNSGGAVHGSFEMPIWGPIFRKLGPDPSSGHLRALNVTKYIESIQGK